MIRFLHAADFHLDSAFAALTPEEASERRRESRELLDRLADEARARKADLVLLAGDLLDGEAYRETEETLVRALGTMGVPVFIAPGNHDWYGPTSPYARLDWPDNVHIFRTSAVESVELPELGAVVHGAAFTAPEQRTSLLEGICVPEDGRVHLMVLHGDLNDSAARYDPIGAEQVSASGLAYLALGHVHARGGPLTLGRTTAAWPGCPEGRGFDETGEKGIYEGTVSDDGTVSLTFVPLSRHRYECLTVDVTGQAAEAALDAALPRDGAGDFYRVTLTGETGEPLDRDALEARFAPRFAALELRDETRAAEDLWSRAGEDSLRGEFLRALRRRLDAAQTPRERETIARAARFGLAALDHRDLG